ncbi:hypothetical protein EYF80_023639 [Liparis tanakae]|uniref:Uncharacterized protein n=1 Tax=Liparis tanakae TaxID=230148 RepID=A0A4Z2HKN6_9TELE|nr:hypothetical protein EYF80_023639 [Liparis tanakae]
MQRKHAQTQKTEELRSLSRRWVGGGGARSLGEREREKRKGGGLYTEHQASRVVVGARVEIRGGGRKEEEVVVQWNSGRMRLNARLVDMELQEEDRRLFLLMHAARRYFRASSVVFISDTDGNPSMTRRAQKCCEPSLEEGFICGGFGGGFGSQPSLPLNLPQNQCCGKRDLGLSLLSFLSLVYYWSCGIEEKHWEEDAAAAHCIVNTFQRLEINNLATTKISRSKTQEE